MRSHISYLLACLVVACAALLNPPRASAQPLGPFTWQLQPFCNRVTLSVTPTGSVFRLDGFDDQCGASVRAPLVGEATTNPSGTIGFGLSIVATPGGNPVHVDATISLATLNGTWRDSAGNSGAFVLTPGAAVPGPQRAVTGAIGVAAIDATKIQRRVTGTCPAGQAVRTVNENGTVVCEPVSGSGIGVSSITVALGGGLFASSSTGAVQMNVLFGGDGDTDAASRSDHVHRAAGTDSTGIGGATLNFNTGSGNTAVGRSALAANTSGSQNTALGTRALSSNTVVANSTAVGFEALRNTSTGGINTAIGSFSQFSLTTGASNTSVGAFALQTATTAQNNVALGRSALQDVTTSDNVAVGSFAMQDASSGTRNTGIGRGAIRNVTTGSDNTALGAVVGQSLVTGSKVTLIGSGAETTTDSLSNATAIGANAIVSASNSLVLGSINGVNGATSDTNVGIGEPIPADRLHVNGIIRVDALGAAGATALCRNASNQIATCSSSLRYKTDVRPYARGLDVIRALEPIRFTWKADGLLDVGFAAEQVERLEPLLTTRNVDGQVEGVRYDRLTTVLVNAIKELQATVESLQHEVNALKSSLGNRQ